MSECGLKVAWFLGKRISKRMSGNFKKLTLPNRGFGIFVFME